MILNKVHFKEALLTRLENCTSLMENPQTLSYAPEILLRTLRDSFRLITEDFASAGVLDLCNQLNLDLSPTLKQELLAWEDSLRSPQKYAELKPNPQLLLDFTSLLKKLLF
ncbi:MAG: hypothetical protein ACRCY4_04710 [Brevinema sp.]